MSLSSECRPALGLAPSGSGMDVLGDTDGDGDADLRKRLLNFTNAAAVTDADFSL